MNTQFFCKNRDRWKKIVAQEPHAINGIDYLEVASEDQKTLKLFFLFSLPGQSNGVPSFPLLRKENIFIEGGVRVKNINVLNISAADNTLTITVDKAGDFSTYTLRLSVSATDKETPPDGFDQQLSTIDFSFKINCPNEFDCKDESLCMPSRGEEPNINYLAKDYASFNRLMLDRLSVIMPDWRERNAADLQIALLEILAYVGDHLSYYQDAVATEAYLHTARRRVSLKRHARLLDYSVHDGCNARTWVHIEVAEGSNADGGVLKKGTLLLTNGDDTQVMLNSLDVESFFTKRNPIAFETMYAVTLRSEYNEMPFYTWGDADCCLQKGATQTTLVDTTSGKSYGLAKGDVLIFEEVVHPGTGNSADADPTHRHAVRIKQVKKRIDKLTGTPVLQIEWHEQDALPFLLRISAITENGPMVNACVARGNIVLADHGITQSQEALHPAMALDEEEFYPRLLNVYNTTSGEKYDHTAWKSKAALAATTQDPHQALPAVSLHYNTEIWNAQKDLLGSDRFATEFVVETEQDGTSFLRFGDDICGKKPIEGFKPRATYRIGNGKQGNIGRDTLNVVLWDTDGIFKVRNPLPAAGGTDAETAEEVRQFAPYAFRTQERAVTEADYVKKTELHAEVQNAAAKFYWTGSWYTVYMIIDRKGGKDIDDAFKENIRLHLEKYRMAGYDLEIRAPKYVPLHITLRVCVHQGYFKSDIKQKLFQLFSNAELSNGEKAFFHPDNFTFGQPLYLSTIYEKAMGIDGIASVEIILFKRWAKPQGSEIQDALLQPAELEILRLDNDPNFPENGKIDFIMLGGL
ncbi:MAG TPA: baseplate J/gp47 family protein [Flavipsychrobacter sp.]|nr:baseplate J/gp47 family protein [Flavipsychrobacter sp.]